MKRLDKKATDLTQSLKQKEEELEQLEDMMRDRDNIIEELERILLQNGIDGKAESIKSKISL